MLQFARLIPYRIPLPPPPSIRILPRLFQYPVPQRPSNRSALFCRKNNIAMSKSTPHLRGLSIILWTI